MKNTMNSGFNRGVHEANVDSEDAMRAEHAALAKMATMPDPVPSTAGLTPVAPVTPLAPPTHAPANPMEHPAFHGIINALKKPKAANTLSVAGMPKAPK